VLYDDESWCFTPKGEKSSPSAMHAAEEAAAQAVHAAGLQLLAAPAQDIVTSMGTFSGDLWDRYLRLGLAGIAAKHADAFEVQSQALQPVRSDFVAFVREAAAQARTANPKVKVLAGLTTNPASGNVPTAYDLCELVMATRAYADGYWLNLPKQGTYCPSCSPDPHADVGVELLRRLRSGSCSL
jgi:hypothetical protein